MNAHAHNPVRGESRSRPQPPARISRPASKPGCGAVSPGLRGQSGSLLLESFIAILIFSMGILAIVGMQASAIKNSAEAKYRSEASLLANELVGKMWVGDRTPATLQARFQGGAGTDGADYTLWYSDVKATLPDASTYAPTVTVNPATGLVSVTVRWKAPNEAAAAPAHNFAMLAQIR